MRYLLVMGFIALAIPISFLRPVYAASFLIWADIFRPFSWAKTYEPFQIALVVVAVLAASFTIGLIRKQITLRPNRATICMAIFLGWSFISAYLAPNRDFAMVGFLTEIKILAPILFISMTIATLNDAKVLLWTLALSVGIYGAQAGVHAIIVGHPVTDMAIDGGQMTDRNDFILAVLVSLPLLLFIVKHYKGYFRIPVRILIGLFMVFSVIAVPLSNSRGGILGLAVTVLFTTALSKRKWRNLALLIALTPLILLAVPQSVWERMNTIELGEHQEEGSAAERLQQMTGGIHMARDNPLTGVGPYSFINYILDYTPAKLEAHSVFIKCAAELGIPGLLIYLGSLFYIFMGLFSIYRRYFGIDKFISSLAVSLCMSHISFWATAAFVNQLYSEYYWCLIALSGGVISVVKEREIAIKKERLRIRSFGTNPGLASATGAVDPS